jgi:hypothetical protein
MSMRRFAIGCFCSLLTAAVVSSEEAGWKDLFNGKDLSGWVQKGGKAKYFVENGEIVGITQPNTPNSFLCTTREFTNFILELQFKVSPGLNSGVQIRSHEHAKATELEWKGKTHKVPAGRVHGYQIEIDTTKRAWTGGLYEEGRRGWLHDLSKNDAARNAFKQNEWNQFRIEAVGDSIKTFLNGVPAADFRDPIETSGFIGLQVHGVGKRTNDLSIRFRNVRVKELP